MWMKVAGVALLISVLTSVCTNIIEYRWLSVGPDIVTVDLQLVVADEIGSNSKIVASDSDRQLRAQRFSRALEKALNKIGGNGQRVVMVAPAVLRGGVDATGTLRSSIEAEMEGYNQ